MLIALMLIVGGVMVFAVIKARSGSAPWATREGTDLVAEMAGLKDESIKNVETNAVEH